MSDGEGRYQIIPICAPGTLHASTFTLQGFNISSGVSGLDLPSNLR